jgi:hypothetical protein
MIRGITEDLRDNRLETGIRKWTFELRMAGEVVSENQQNTLRFVALAGVVQW